VRLVTERRRCREAVQALRAKLLGMLSSWTQIDRCGENDGRRAQKAVQGSKGVFSRTLRLALRFAPVSAPLA